MSALTVTLKTPTETFFEGEANALRLKTDLGRMEVLPGHATFVGTILYSKVYIRHASTEEKFIIRQGSISIDENGVCSILALSANKEEELSVDSMKDYLEYLDEQLNEEGKYNDYQMKFLREQREALEGSMNDSE